MKKYMACLILMLAFAVLTVSFCVAENVVSTTVLMRVSKMTQEAVVNAGEDLSMEVNIDGVEPAGYQWYFEDAPIAGANQKAYSIVDADVEDSGVYRMDAFDENGAMLVSMDIRARVIGGGIPQSGDVSMPVGVAAAAFVLSAGLLLCALRRRARA